MPKHLCRTVRCYMSDEEEWSMAYKSITFTSGAGGGSFSFTDLTSAPLRHDEDDGFVSIVREVGTICEVCKAEVKERPLLTDTFIGCLC